MQIRTFRLSDYFYVNQLLAEVLSEACYNETNSALARQLSWDSELVMVAEDEAQECILGVIIGTIDNNNGYYYRIAVDSEHRRKGIGKQLILAMGNRFRQRDVNRILIAVDEHEESQELSVFDAVGYFERFLPIGRRVLSIANSH